MTTSRLALFAFTVFAASAVVVGCASTPGGQAPAPGTPTSDASDDARDVSGDDIGDDLEAAWLDDGRMFGIVSWGSSTCVPFIDEVTADGQAVTVTFAEPEADQACTSDFAPRVSVGGLPEGVDPTQDVEFIVTLDGVTDDVDLDGNAALTGVPGEGTDYAPSAGWFDDDGIVLLTWGSSSCPPIVEDVTEEPGGATVTFQDQEGACTQDMAPRGTLIGLGGEDDDDAAFVLTLVGDHLDGTVEVLRS